MRSTRRFRSGQSEFRQGPSLSSRWLHTGHAREAIASRVLLAHATQIHAGPMRRYGHVGHWGNPGGSPAGSTAMGLSIGRSQVGESQLLLLLGRLPDPFGRGELGAHLVNVAYLDRAALAHVVPGPGLGGDEGADEEHLLAVVEGEPRLHLGTRGTGCLDHDGALADARCHDIAAWEGVSAR